MGTPKLSAEGEIDYLAPKTRESKRRRRGVGSGEGCPLPSLLGGLGSVVSSPSGARGGAQAANAFCDILGQENIFLDSKMHFKKYICVLSIA